MSRKKLWLRIPLVVAIVVLWLTTSNVLGAKIDYLNDSNVSSNVVEQGKTINDNVSDSPKITLPDFKLPYPSNLNYRVRFTGGPHQYYLPEPVFTQQFYYGKGSGIDFAAEGKSFPVAAMAAGWLTKAECEDKHYDALGCVVTIVHPDGQSSLTYAHLDKNSEVFKQLQQIFTNAGVHWVEQGDQIGDAGSTGGGARGKIHLHLELQEGNPWDRPTGSEPGQRWGQPIGWETYYSHGGVDGYWIWGYGAENVYGPGAKLYNYDGVAVKYAAPVFTDNFRYKDGPPDTPRSDVRTMVGADFACPSASYNQNDCEINTYASTQFARVSGGGFWGTTLAKSLASAHDISGLGHGQLVSTNEIRQRSDDQASLISDLTLPDGISVSPSQSLVKTWRLKNTGTSTWGTGYQFAFMNGEQMSAPNAVNVPSTAPNATADISINLTAPTVAGDHSGYWQLRNPQGTYFGPKVWVKIKVITTNSGNNHIAVFDTSPVSPSTATSVHLVGRINTFPEFRSMRFVLGNDIREMTNFRSVGSQYEISVDWNTASLARGSYTLALEVATQGDTSWANPERRIQTYTLTGTPASTNRPPDRPVLLSPYNWYLKDAAGSSASVQMCVSPVNDPDGDAVQYYFDVTGASPTNSGWISSTCWSSTLSPNGYAWHVKTRDSKGAESGWSVETWNFNVAYGNVSIDTPSFYQVTDPDNTHMCVFVTYGGIIAPEVKAWVNLANDGSENGEWQQLDHYGPSAPPDCTTSNVHGFWIRSANYQTGNHAVRISAVKNDSGASANRTVIHNIPYMRPSAPRAIAPSNSENNGTWWNTPTITFTWSPSLRANGYRLRASTSTDVWNDPAPVLDISLGSNVTSTNRTFSQDYSKLTWSVRASNSVGSADSGGLWFGIDRVLPSCTVTAPNVSYDNIFQVNWGGTDNAAGIRSYEIGVLDSESGTNSIWRAVPAAQTYDLFNGQPGHHYTFNCRVTDNAGNVSGWLSNASTKVDPNARPAAPWWNSNYAYKRQVTVLNNMPSMNLPNSYPVKLRFDSTTSPSATEIYNASLSSPKCNDLRIVYNDTTQLNRVVTKCSASEVEMWFRTQSAVAGGGNSNVYQMYYGYASASSPLADPNQVWYPYREGDTTYLYSLQEGSGSTAYDSSGNNRSCSIDPSIQWGQSKFGNGLYFNRANDGNSRSLTCGASIPLSSYTIEFWYKAGADGGGRIAGELAGGGNGGGGNNWLLNDADGRIALDIWEGCGGLKSDFNLRDQQYVDKWNHIAISFNGANELKFYVNGILDSTKSFSGCSRINTYTPPLEIGSSENISQIKGTLGSFRISNGVKTSFPYGAFANIINEPLAQTGTLQTPPVSGTRTLEVVTINTYPNSSGGIVVEGLVRNSGTLSTGNGFSTDLYLNHVPTGQGDLTGRVSFWINDPISAGGAITLTTIITNTTQLSGLWANATARPIGPLTNKAPTRVPAFPLRANADGETSGTFYAQVDTTGAVMNGATSKSIYSAGKAFCLANPDAYEPVDALPSSASVIPLNGTQRHNFDTAGDQDWVSFTAVAGKTYRIFTNNLAATADTYLYLYSSDKTTLLASNDDVDGTLASRIDWTAPSNGMFYLKVTGWNPNSQGCGTSYNLSLGYAPNNSVYFYLPFIRK